MADATTHQNIVDQVNITGSCNCGRHTYTVPKPTEMNLCHCVDCRKWAGAMHSAHLFVKTKDINFHNSPEPRTHVMKSEVGNDMERAWCDNCGCGIWIRTSRAPELTYLKAGLFQPGEIPNPSMENWLRNKEPWETQATGTKYASQVQ